MVLNYKDIAMGKPSTEDLTNDFNADPFKQRVSLDQNTRQSKFNQEILQYPLNAGNDGGMTPAGHHIQFEILEQDVGAIKFGELATARKYPDTAGNTVRALAAGGVDDSDSTTNSIEFVTIATEGNATDFGDLHSATSTGKSGSVSSATRGIFAGFYPVSGGDKRMDFVSITSAGSAQDFGDLTTAAYYTGGCSDSNGGLGE